MYARKRSHTMMNNNYSRICMLKEQNDEMAYTLSLQCEKCIDSLESYSYHCLPLCLCVCYKLKLFHRKI